MVTQGSGDSQAKIKVWLEILPKEEMSNSDRRLAEEIATRIANSNLLNQAQGYKVEVPYTGAQGIPHGIWVWIGEQVGGALIAMGTEMLVKKGLDIIRLQNSRIDVNKLIKTIVDLTKKIREILNNERYRKRQASIKVQFPPEAMIDIHEQGHLMDVLTKIGKQLTEASPDPKQIRITENIEISFSIKVSHKNSK